MEIGVADKRYTVAEFQQLEELDENSYYELINGEIVKRSSPHPRHQIILGNLNEAIRKFVKDKKAGIVLFAPVDVFLDQYNALMPDLIFIAEARKSILTDNGVEGTPDLVIEILSPGTAKYDRGDKMKVYRKHQVREYWLVDPKLQSVEVYVYRDGDYDLDFLETAKGKVQSVVLEGFALEIDTIFE